MKRLQNTFASIHTLDIHDSAELREQNPVLYKELFVNISDFIFEIIFRSHKNKARLMVLRQNFCIDISDIHMDCLAHIMDKLDKVLAKDTKYQISYLYTMCNHIIIDTYRQAIQYYHNTVSLNEALDSHETNTDSNKFKSFEDYVEDKKAKTESSFLLKEAAIEIYTKYSGNADSLLCALSSKILGDKPAELAQTLLRTSSVDSALNEYIDNMCLTYNIRKSELPIHANTKTTGLSKVLSHTLTEEAAIKALSSKISNITNRTK